MAISAIQPATGLDRLAPKVTLAAVLCVVIAIRIPGALHFPLWLDETWTGMIATQPDWPRFWKEAWLDVNPPFYYLFMRGWTSLFGDSDITLRLPSILFFIAAGIAPLIWRLSPLNQAARWTWAALLLAWYPGIMMVAEARSYSLLYLLGVCLTIIFAKLFENISIKNATLWVGLSTLMFLTHYYAATLIFAQCLVLLCKWRLQLAKLWPSILAALPGFAWFAIHADRMSQYLQPESRWYSEITMREAISYAIATFGAPNALMAFAMAVIAGFVLYSRRRHSQDREAERSLTGPAAAAAAGVLAMVITIAIGLSQASLIFRYLTPLTPSVLLSLALLVQVTPSQFLISSLLLVSSLAPTLKGDNQFRALATRNNYGFEEASDFVAKYHPEHLVFVWDSANVKIMDKGSLRQIGSYFLRRNGQNPETDHVAASLENLDSRQLTDISGNKERAAVIWLFGKRKWDASASLKGSFDLPSWHCYRSEALIAKDVVNGSIACVNKEGVDD